MEAFIKIVESIQTEQPNINPTEIYNEGWMTRLLVHYSIKHQINVVNLDFSMIKNWTSEALMSSPFILEVAQPYREGYTHADVALGDFNVDYEVRGEIDIPNDARVFGIIEAKMKSNLSAGTTYVKDYNQASRNIACIAHNTRASDCKIFFVVVIPEQMKEKHGIVPKVDKTFVYNQIQSRFELYDENHEVRVNESAVLSKVKKCEIIVLTYEDWISTFTDSQSREFLSDFYEKCRKYNRLK
ncbi:hypothetical protein [uncultured Draconibacterium sp.]|uniref:hypothetical protein n=1 Tax=uncultured Draconibacterium sp. TaxID=1573823 RepID=UPI0025E5F619|nr:hypothetical protein [uncultured Draconibacterium sp.]